MTRLQQRVEPRLDSVGASHVLAAVRCDDTTLGPADSLSGEEANVMIQTVGSLVKEDHRTRVPAASAWAG